MLCMKSILIFPCHTYSSPWFHLFRYLVQIFAFSALLTFIIILLSFVAPLTLVFQITWVKCIFDSSDSLDIKICKLQHTSFSSVSWLKLYELKIWITVIFSTSEFDSTTFTTAEPSSTKLSFFSVALRETPDTLSLFDGLNKLTMSTVCCFSQSNLYQPIKSLLWLISSNNNCLYLSNDDMASFSKVLNAATIADPQRPSVLFWHRSGTLILLTIQTDRLSWQQCNSYWWHCRFQFPNTPPSRSKPFSLPQLFPFHPCALKDSYLFLALIYTFSLSPTTTLKTPKPTLSNWFMHATVDHFNIRRSFAYVMWWCSVHSDLSSIYICRSIIRTFKILLLALHNEILRTFDGTIHPVHTQ